MRVLAMRRAQQGVGNHKTQRLVAQLQRSSLVQRQCSCGETCESCQSSKSSEALEETDETGVVQRQAAGASGAEATVPHDIIPADSPGQKLDHETRGFMESRFGTDFSDVRVHTDGRAAQSADALAANAYTTGRDIYFAAGKYAPGSREGQGLLAHELTHTVQDGESNLAFSRTESLRVSTPGEPMEREAHQVASHIESERVGVASGDATAGVTVGSMNDGLIQRDPNDSNVPIGPPTLDQQYNAAVQSGRQTGNWQDAAELLNGFNHEDIQNRLAQLTSDEIAYLHLGALDNPRVGPQSQVAQLTAPGAPRASTAPPNTSQAPLGPAAVNLPPQAAAGKSISDMSATDKLIEAYQRANIGDAVRQKVSSLISPKALVIAILSFAAVFLVSQFTPVGWAADLGIFLTAVFVGTALLSAIEHLIKFAEARNATTSEELDQAGAEFAAAVAEVEIDTIIILVTHGVGGPAEGGVPYEGPPPPGFVLARAGRGSAVRVATNTISAEQAAQLGIKGTAAGTAMMSQGGGESGGGAAVGDFTPAEDGPYKDIQDKTKIEPGRDFQEGQKIKIREANKARNGGRLKSDDPNDPYQDLSEPVQSRSPGMGGSPQDPAMASIDHIHPAKAGGTNSYGNARVISQFYNNYLRSKGL
jgi:hypothetical protein